MRTARVAVRSASKGNPVYSATGGLIPQGWSHQASWAFHTSPWGAGPHLLGGGKLDLSQMQRRTVEWKELHLSWEFLGLGLEQGCVKLNWLLLIFSCPTHHVLPNSTVSSFLRKGDGEDAQPQTPMWKLNCYKGRQCFVTSSKNSVSQDL